MYVQVCIFTCYIFTAVWPWTVQIWFPNFITKYDFFPSPNCKTPTNYVISPGDFNADSPFEFTDRPVRPARKHRSYVFKRT